MNLFLRPRSSWPWLARLFAGLLLLTLVVSASPSTEAAPASQDLSQWRTYANGDDIWSMAFEGPNVIWAGTRGGGVIRWDISNLDAPTPIQYLFPQDKLAGNYVRSLAVDTRGSKWFATDRGLSQLTSDNQWRTYTRASTGGKLPSDLVTAVTVQGTNTLWVGTQRFWSASDKKWLGGGFAQVDISTDPPTWKTTWNADDNSDIVPSNNVTDIAVDPSNGDVWITMRTDEKNVEPTSQKPDTYFSQRAGGITVVHTSGTPTLEMFQRQSGDSNSWPKYDSILTVAVDGTGLKWFGTGDLDSGGAGFHVLKGNTRQNAQWKWFDAPGSTQSGQTIRVGSMPDGANRIINIAVGANDVMYVSMAGDTPNVDRGAGLGVCRMTWDRNFAENNAPTCTIYNTSGGTTNLPLPGNLVRAFLIDPQREVAFYGTGGRLPDKGAVGYPQGTDGYGIGMVRANPPGVKTMSTFGLTLSSNHISAVGFKDDGTVWVGTAYPIGVSSEAWGGSGIDILQTNGRWARENLGGNVSKAVSSLAFDNKGRLWVGMLKEQRIDGTFVDGGVAVDRQPWVIYQSGPGLPSNSITSLASGGSRMWVGTGSKWPDQHGSGSLAQGISIYNTDTESWETPIQSPTILGNEITSLAGRGSQLWAGATWPLQPGVNNLPGGLSFFDGTSWTNYSPGQNGLTFTANDPRTVFVAPDGTVWAGGYFSAGLPDPVLADAVINWRPSGQSDWQSVVFDDDGWVSSIVYRQKGGGSIWIGTTRGGQNIEDFPPKVFPAGRGNVYNATGGIRVYVNGQWRTFTPANSPLVNGHINTLAVDGNDVLWIGTSLGLMRYEGDIPGATVVPSTPIATYTPSPTPLPTGTPVPTGTAVMITPAAGGRAVTLTAVVPTPTNTPFPGSPPPEIPEASTLWLLGSGLAGLAGYIRFFARRRR